jgi:hypothetical protein
MRGLAELFTSRPLLRPLLSATAMVAISAGLAACGGSSGSGGGDTTNAAAFGPGGQLSASDRECLQKHGLNFRTPGSGNAPVPPPGASGTSTTGGGPVVVGPGGRSGPTQLPDNVRKAFQACGVSPPTFSAGGPPPDVNSSAYRSSVNRYVTCVKQNGYDLPAPNLSGNGPIFDESKVNRDDPTFQAASRKCQHLLQPPSPSQGSSSSSEG